MHGRTHRLAGIAARGTQVSLIWWVLVGGVGMMLVAPLVLQPQRTAVDPVAMDAQVADALVRYGKDIRPILSDRCFQCHGPDGGTLEADLRLDIRASALAERPDGPAAIIPGDPLGSELYRRITSTDPTVQMPPRSSHKALLSRHERELIRRWIEQGAEYEAHWAFVPPVRPPLPDVEGWGHNAIDAFTLRAMQRAGISPSPHADRITLLRRAFLDITGLPPTPEEVDAYLKDSRPDAYERWVDRLLSKEPYRTRFAEHMTSPWLDQARYADTIGIHTDAGRQMWLWRDWVIDAYRTGMPFDQFIIEQLAGDLLPDATTQQIIATGFNRNHVITDEGGAIDEEYLVEYAIDRTTTVGSVMFGLTFDCARCHDHKFDPISMQDFYSLYAFFNSNDEPGLYTQIADSNRAFEPFIEVPTPQQAARLAEIDSDIARLRVLLEQRSPAELERQAAFASEMQMQAGVRWPQVIVSAAESSGGASLEIMDDNAIRASGNNPDVDDYAVQLRAKEAGLQLIVLEVLEEPTAFEGRLGRAPNGNAVITGIEFALVSMDDGSVIQTVPLVAAWTDWAQQNGDFAVTNVLDAESNDGWALDAHTRRGSRIALLLAERPFDLDDQVEARITIRQQSIYAQHSIARFRLSLAAIDDVGLSMLPTASSRWYRAGPFPADADGRVWEPVVGPETQTRLDRTARFGEEQLAWQFDGRAAEGSVLALPSGRNMTYLGKRVFSPTARDVPVSLGSDDGFRLFVNGEEVAGRQIDRGVAPDQDSAVIPLKAGENAVVMKIVNTGGPGGFYFRSSESAQLRGDLAWTLLPERMLSAELAARAERAWSENFLPRYRETAQQIDALEAEATEIRTTVPRTMVMKELEDPRATFVLTAGHYDQPDPERPVQRAVPSVLGNLADDAPANRLGLAQWMVSAENPLLARVTVNRLWEQFFGIGIVETSEDFGLQGAWPSHPELLDWLAVEFRESGWDLQHMIRLIVTSATYRQRSIIHHELHEIDPDNRLLAYFPKRRLTAEMLRDQALHVSGLLVEKVGGPSVKPYQPEALWEEVAMPQSNTRTYQQGSGEDLWRRSLYTYWKRAVPPPSMAAFDAPTRESCVTRRIATSTPMQALVLLNDEQFREAARVLAQRTMLEQDSDEQRIGLLMRRCLARDPEPREIDAIVDVLNEFRERYRQQPDATIGLIQSGESPVPDELDHAELAAWTMIASSILNLYQTTTQE